MRKTKQFTSYEEYESWTEQFENCSDYEEIPTIIDDGWKIAADLFVECRSWKTALRRFAKAFDKFSDQIMGWVECMEESAENGYFQDTTGWRPGWTTDPETVKEWAKNGIYGYGIEEISEGLWYIYLNISGCYAGREKTA